MLRNVLEDYLDSIIERDFDYPILTLLQGMGFFDIHFTHGGVEFGKDFIAKKLDDGVPVQYAIQSKKGDIGQHLWRNEIRGQLEEAILSDLSHPQFDTQIPRKAILVTTGRISGNARLASQEFKEKIEGENHVQELIFWEKEQLIQYAEEFGLTGIYQNTARGLKGFAQFYLIYSKAIEGNLSQREIEVYSRLWLDETLDHKKRILRASLETEIIVSRLLTNGRIYEALSCYLSLARLVLLVGYETDDVLLREIYKEILDKQILFFCEVFYAELKTEWQEAKQSLAHMLFSGSPLPMLNYIVWCARILEVSSLYYFLTKDAGKKDEIVSFVISFLQKEEGCGHIPSDRYATTMVWVTLLLVQSGNTDTAIELVKQCVVWLCDRVENGFGLARYEANEYDETVCLLGYPFDFIKVEKNTNSFLATVLTDLAAFLDQRFYEDVINDLLACEITYYYWQFPDSKAIAVIDTNECIAYANVPHNDSLNDFGDFDYAAHVKDEPKSFEIVDKWGKQSLVLLSVLLKDRYFPTMWPKIIEN